MPTLQAQTSTQNRLQIVFDYRAVSCTLSETPTFAEVARKLARFSFSRYGAPVAIAVTVAAGCAPQCASVNGEGLAGMSNANPGLPSAVVSAG